MIMCTVTQKIPEGKNYKLTLKAKSEFTIGDILTDQKNFDYMVLEFINPKDAERTKKEITIICQQLD